MNGMSSLSKTMSHPTRFGLGNQHQRQLSQLINTGVEIQNLISP